MLNTDIILRRGVRIHVAKERMEKLGYKNLRLVYWSCPLNELYKE